MSSLFRLALQPMFLLLVVLAGAFFANSQANADTYISIVSQPGDYIGGGTTASYTAVTASASADQTYVSFSAGGYSYEFKSPVGSTLAAGTYRGATRYPFNFSDVPGLSVYGNGRGCNTLTGRFVVRELEFIGTAVNKAAIDYEQHCEGGTPAMFGYIRFNSSIALDSDGDGINDLPDNCPMDSNSNQQDTDGDGIGDACDPTPFFADSDLDGVNNSVDNCPFVANPDQLDCECSQIY